MKIKKRISLRISILSLYAITFIVLMSLLIALESYAFLHAVSDFSSSLLNRVSIMVMKELQSKGEAPETIAKLTKSLLENGFVDENEMMEYSLFAAKNTLPVHLNKPARLSLWVDVQGNSVSTFLEPDGTYSTAVMKPNLSPPLHRRYYRDRSDTIIKSIEVPLVDMRTEHRFQDAVKTGHFMWTDAYLSPENNNLTSSALVPIYHSSGRLLGVFNVDVKLESLADFLTNLKIGTHGVAFLLNGKNQLIAFPGMTEWLKKHPQQQPPLPISILQKAWLDKALSIYQQEGKAEFSFKYANETYIASFKVLPESISAVAAHHWKVGVVIPKSDFTSTFDKQNILRILMSISIILIGIILALVLSKLITTRLKMLVNETEKIKNFNFEGKIIDSIIKEVHLLAKAIFSMKNNLRSFKKYLPATLVQQLIQSGQDINLGGDIKTLSILFSDIKNFTKIAERTRPNQLMEDLSEYLEAISKTISQTQGTIDKFIGDSIMAFWSAPLPDADHCEHACRAALQCRDEINKLNARWIKENKAPYVTRFGVHTGEVIVGNVGSMERMNYTAIGDTINVTRRLEELNKIYDTSIIVSAKVMQTVKHKFLFRKLDETLIKGKTGGHVIYELLGAIDAPLPFDLKTYQALFEQGFALYQKQEWPEAISCFEKAKDVYPEDSVSQVFIQRCKHFISHPPKKGWKGVWDGERD